MTSRVVLIRELGRTARSHLDGMAGPEFIVVAAYSIGEGDEWYFRASDGSTDCNSDRLHVTPSLDWMSCFTLTDTADPDGLAQREAMLAAGWTFSSPDACPTCGWRPR